MSIFSIPNTNAVSIYITILFGIGTIIAVFRLWLKASCGKFVSDVKMDGKTVIVTGANSGIGKETARDLAKRGARVIMACRNLQTANAARDEITRESGNKNVVVMKIDLSSLQSVRDFAAEVLRKEDHLDIIIHNAGCAGALKKEVSVDGIEMTMATNHYGSFLLTHLLIDLLKKSAPSRIVIVASKNHQISTLDPLSMKSLNPVDFCLPFHLYNNSKMANILFCFELARRLKGTNITANCLHPGVVDTGIWRSIPFPLNILMFIVKQFLKNNNQGIQTILYVALAPELNNVSGKFFRECKESVPNPKVHNKIWWTALWDASKELVKLTSNDPQI